MPLSPGHQISDRYHVVRLAGQGGQAEVYLAADEVTGDRVAVKVARDSGGSERLMREGDLLARIRSPHVVGYRDHGFDPGTGRMVLVLDWLSGCSLLQWVRRLPPASSAVSRILLQLAKALTAVHEAQHVMRDLSLSQVMVAGRRGLPDVTLMDLGLARFLGSVVDLTQPGLAAGTPGYTAPEVLLGRAVDARADTYSLACVAWRLLVGQEAFCGNCPQVTYALQLLGPPELPGGRTTGLASLDSSVVEWLRLGLSVHPEDRPGPPLQWAEGLVGRL
jgi:serine/threonine-protein kinase